MEELTLFLDPAGGQPLYRQLYDALSGQILSGQLAAGERLPSKRRLAQELRLSVNTVDTAYQMLAAEGYLQARPRSGFTVRRVERVTFAAPEPVTLPAPEPAPAWEYDLGTGGTDPALFPVKTWQRLQRDVLSGGGDLLRRGHPQGDENFRTVLARYLRESRGAVCSPDQIVVGAGMEVLLGNLSRLLAGETFAVEDPGYPQTTRILANNGASAVFLPVDGEGLEPKALAASAASVVVVTPSHQFPTGVTMPAGRRTELLGWAARAPHRLLIEDDYDSEFRFDGRPLPCLQGLDGGERVIYIGTFSRGVAPGIRAAYMALPVPLLARYRGRFGAYACTVGRLEQQTLCRFLEEGHYARHLARCRTAYRRRRDALIAALTDALGERITFSGQHTGLHLLARVELGLSQQELIRRAKAAGVRLAGLGDYAHLDPVARREPVLVLGYGGLPEDRIPAAAHALAAAWQ